MRFGVNHLFLPKNVTSPNKLNPTRAGSQIGARTHHQDQAITEVNFRTIKTIININRGEAVTLVLMLVERGGIEPPYLSSKPNVLPLNYLSV